MNKTNKLYLDIKDVKIYNLNVFINLSNSIGEEGYKINSIQDNDQEDNIEISFSKDDIEGTISYEKRGYIFLLLSNTKECIKLFNRMTLVLEEMNTSYSKGDANNG